VKVLHLGKKKQKIRWLNVAMEVGNGVWGKHNSHIEGLSGQMEGRKIVDATMMFRRYLQGGMIGESEVAGPHAVNL